jgi:hypothetical protein
MAAQFRQQLLSLTSAGGRGYLIDRAVHPDPDPAFQVKPDPDPIRIQGFDDQKLKRNTAENIFIYLF